MIKFIVGKYFLLLLPDIRTYTRGCAVLGANFWSVVNNVCVYSGCAWNWACISLLSSVRVVKHCPAAVTTRVGHWSINDKKEIKKPARFNWLIASTYFSENSLYMKTIILLSSIALFLQYSYPKLQIIHMKFSATSQIPILLSWSSSSLRGVSLITSSITVTILGNSLLKGVKMSYWTYSWQTSNSTVHKFLYTDK